LIESEVGLVGQKHECESPDYNKDCLDHPQNCSEVHSLGEALRVRLVSGENSNSMIERASLSNTANAYSVVYLDFGGQGNGHGELMLHSYALSMTVHP
jgi:hypothetical protein